MEIIIKNYLKERNHKFIMSAISIVQKTIVDIFSAINMNVGHDECVIPPQKEMGDVAFPCFTLASELGKKPNEVASFLCEQLKGHMSAESHIQSIVASGPYINFFIDIHWLAGQLFEEILNNREKYGTNNQEHSHILFEYSQPNTHKEFHIGHVRNVVLGYSLVQLYRHQGNVVEAITYVNDIGSHVAKCLWSLKKFFADKIPTTEKGRFLGKVYGHTGSVLKEHPEMKIEIQELLQKLESGDAQTLALWKKTRQWSLNGFRAIYTDRGIEFDDEYYESDVKQDGQRMVDELLARGIAKISEGVAIVDLSDEGSDVLVVRKSDGTGLYATSDFGLALAKNKKQWDESIVMTDVRQALYFKQLFVTLNRYGMNRTMRHIGYEFVKLDTGLMSSRTGNVILFENMRDEVIGIAYEETKMRHPLWSESKLKKTAHHLAIASIKFSMLKIKPSHVITFSTKEALSLSGFSAPYVLYMYARIQSMLKKITVVERTAFSYPLRDVTETSLVLMLAHYPVCIRDARLKEDPSVVCKFVYELARAFSSFYETCSVVDAEYDVRNARIQLIQSVACVFHNSLTILGITPIKEM